MPELTVLCGGGGVGKTSTSAALGVALAREGQRTLVVTIDPARRLADALGVTVGSDACEVALVPGRLFVRMPEARTLADDLLAWLFEDEATRARLHANLAYRELADAIVGAHEMLALTFVERDLQSGLYDHVVLDTAPSRHALDFLTYPKRLLDLLEARSLRWLADMAPRGGREASGPRRRDRLLAWGRDQAEGLFARAIGEDATHAVAELLGEVVHVRRRWADVIRGAYRRLLGGGARFVLVGAPSRAAMDDVRYLAGRLGQLGPRASGVVLNRADAVPPAALAALEPRLHPAGSGRAAVLALAREYDQRAAAAARAETRVKAEIGRDVPLVRLPTVIAPDPLGIVLAMAERVAPLVRLVRPSPRGR